MKSIVCSLLLGLFCLSQVNCVWAVAKKTTLPPKLEATHQTSGMAEDGLPIAYLAQAEPQPSGLPSYLHRPVDAGLQGAALAVEDNNTTGKFTGQNFRLRDVHLAADADVSSIFKVLVAEGIRHFVVDLPAITVAQLSRLPEAGNVLIYNVGSGDDQLRSENCAGNLLHVLPSRAMLTDALMQYLNKKRWQKVLLVVGPEEADQQYAAAIKRSAQKFGVKIAAEKVWQHTYQDRRTPESEIPVFTQGVDYDVLIVADEADSFGDLLAYRTWLPRPVAGTQGLVPSAWHFTHEQWGALQLQNRFRERAKRWMAGVDYAAWLAVRAIGESASRVKSLDFEKIKSFMLGGEFALAGFKGVPLSFRPWDGQLRQPVLLAQDRALVAVAPVEGFLHPQNELDTLGVDRIESRCKR